MYLKFFFFLYLILRFRLNGLELKHYKAKLIHKVFEGTPFECLNMMFNDQTAYLFGTEIENLRALVTETSKYNWIKLLGIKKKLNLIIFFYDLIKKKMFSWHI